MISRKSSDRRKLFIIMNALAERQGRGWIPGKKRSAKGSGELFPLVEQQYEITIRAIREYEAALPQNPAE